MQCYRRSMKISHREHVINEAVLQRVVCRSEKETTRSSEKSQTGILRSHKNRVPDMTYSMFGGMLNLTQSHNATSH